MIWLSDDDWSIVFYAGSLLGTCFFAGLWYVSRYHKYGATGLDWPLTGYRANDSGNASLLYIL